MADSIETIASNIREGYARGAGAGMGALGSLMADRIEILHEPLQRGDGMWKGSDWAKAEHGAIASLHKAIVGFRQDVEVTVTGENEIMTVSVMSGTLQDGTPLAHKVRSVLTFSNGKIVKSLSYTDSGSESGKLVSKALSTVPEFLKLTEEIMKSRAAAGN